MEKLRSTYWNQSRLPREVRGELIEKNDCEKDEEYKMTAFDVAKLVTENIEGVTVTEGTITHWTEPDRTYINYRFIRGKKRFTERQAQRICDALTIYGVAHGYISAVVPKQLESKSEKNRVSRMGLLFPELEQENVNRMADNELRDSLRTGYYAFLEILRRYGTEVVK